MIETRQLPVEQICSVVSGYAFKSEGFNESGKGLPLIRCRDVNSGFAGLYFDDEYDSSFLVRNGDLLISMDGDFRIVKWRYDLALLNQRVSRLDIKDDCYSKEYILQFLPKALDLIHQKTSFATVKHLSAKSIRAIKIPIPFKDGKPDLEEQKRIAGILDKADAIRQKRQKALKLTDEFLRSLFLDMFGDPVTNPKGWDVVNVNDVTSFITSGSRGWAKYYSESGSLFLRIQNLKNGFLDLNDVAYVNAPDNQEANRTNVKAGDVLLSITADLGRVAVIPDNIDKAHINQHLSILRFIDINPLYAAHYLASSGGRYQFEPYNRRGVKAGLNFDDIRSLKILNPPMKLQLKYQIIVEFHLNRRSSLEIAYNHSNELFSALQQKAFKGEL